MQRLIPTLLIIVITLSSCTLPQTTVVITPTTTPAPARTPIPTPIITPAPTYTPLPSPTAIPVARITDGQKALFDGNYPQAYQQFQNAFSGSSNSDVQATALWGMSLADFETENFPSALESLRLLTQTESSTEHSIHGWFLLGETYYQLERYQEATQAYQKYLALRPNLLDAYIYEKMGDAYTSLGDLQGALQAYQQAEQSLGQQNLTAIKIKIANIYLHSGNTPTALQMYDDIFAASTDDYVKAQIDLLAGQALLSEGKTEEGYGRWHHAVENFPLAYDSYSALVGLVEAGQPVDNFNRGLVDYFAQKYDVALKAFQNYASQNPNHDGTVLHYMALTLREMGDYNSAVDLWNIFIDKYTGNRYWATAWDERAFTQWAYQNNYIAAAEGLEKFTQVTVDSPFAGTYLFDAARIYERAGNLEKAALVWENISQSNLESQIPGESSFQAGIARFRIGAFELANTNFQQSLLLSKDSSHRARALLWIGKTYSALGDVQNARYSWEQAHITDPGGYYAIRSRDLLENRPAFASPPDTNLIFDLSAERAEASSWVRITFSLPADTDLTNLSTLQSDSRFQRGQEFWELGLLDNARTEFEALRESLKTNPADSYRLGNYLLDIGAFRSGIYALREVLTMAGLDEHTASLTAPPYFSHVRYGLYYYDLVQQASQENAYDPLLILSVMRQESLFEGFVHSSAGARGLMQIMPTTGESIALQMGWPANFSANDLYSPLISIRMGTFYLNANRSYLNSDLYATLAAYNGGPGNASIWQNLANGDIDLELEIIRYSETQNYIRSIYETYNTYRSLYSPMQ